MLPRSLSQLRSRSLLLPAKCFLRRTYAKRTTRVRLSDLPQGVLPPLPPSPTTLIRSKTAPYPPTISAVLRTIELLPADAILLTRIGSFYELYFHHAQNYAPLLGIKLARKRTVAGTVPMAGFPVSQLGRYLKVLIRDVGVEGGVAIKESADGEISRVVTPGTLVDDEEIEEAATARGEGNWLVVVSGGEMAWADVATGEFFVQAVASQEDAQREIARIRAVEVIRQDESEESAEEVLRRYVSERLGVDVLDSWKAERRERGDVVKVDGESMKGLEITRTLKEGKGAGSLVKTIDFTSTGGGRRRLKEWITNPLTDGRKIKERLDAVEWFLDHRREREGIVNLLRRTNDLGRILQKFAVARGTAEDLLSLAKTVNIANEIASLAEGRVAVDKPVLQLADKILEAIDEDGLLERQREEEAEKEQVSEFVKAVEEADEGRPLRRKRPKRMLKEADQEKAEPWVMKRHASLALKRLHKQLEDLHSDQQELEAELQSQLEAPSLSLRWTPSGGHICHVRNRDIQTLRETPGASAISSSRTTHSYHLPQWTQLGARIDSCRASIRASEHQLFLTLRSSLIIHLLSLRRLASDLSTLDTLISFATAAQTHSLTRPTFSKPGGSLQAHNIRHIPVALSLLPTTMFTPNSIDLNPHRPHVLTGPNMAGKSTFLRSVAHLVLLAQTGSYVPATYASVPLVDGVFARFGALDDVTRGESSWFVEMKEVASLLYHATPKSLVVCDELGRGTTPTDGEAVAGAVLANLKNRMVKTVFASHFWGLAKEKGVEAWCEGVTVDKEGGWTWERAIKKGVCDETGAIKVAEMAGVESLVLEEAERRRKDRGRG